MDKLAIKLKHKTFFSEAREPGQMSKIKRRNASLDEVKKSFSSFGPIQDLTIIKDVKDDKGDAANEKNRQMFAPEMLGLNTPEQDLHNLGEFGKSELRDFNTSFI